MSSIPFLSPAPLYHFFRHRLGRRTRHLVPIFLILAAVSALVGCANVQYYAQAARGQSEALNRSRPIAEILQDPATSPELKAKLGKTQSMRDFASRELALPDNDSYRRYADLGRPYALWNVFATPELSLKPKEWCFVFFGCSAYHSYFSREGADREAVELRAAGYDVYVAGIAAYSTGGWFNDPLFNTMLTGTEPEIAGMLFHELAHQKLRVGDDTAFNESFAMTVEREGVRRWLASQNAQAQYASYLERHRRREEMTAMLLRYRARLHALYESSATDDEKRAGKQAELDAMRAEYQTLKASWKGYTGFDRWMEQFNNAKFISVSLYSDYVPALEALLARHGGDLPAFYLAAEELAREPKEARIEKLKNLTSTPN